MTDFQYQDMFPLGQDSTPYRLVTQDYISFAEFENRTILKIDPAGLTLLAQEAFRDVAHLLRPGHLSQLRTILDDPQSSANDRFVAMEMQWHRRLSVVTGLSS